jgi:hypothetical protein
VCREDRGPAHALERRSEVEALVRDEGTDALEREEGGVPLVQVEDGRAEPERSQSPRSSDAEQHLLANAVLAIGAVEDVRERAGRGGVGLDV